MKIIVLIFIIFIILLFGIIIFLKKRKVSESYYPEGVQPERYQSRDYVSLAKKYAPLAIFHENQRWGPSSVDYIFQHTELRSMPESSCKKRKDCDTAPKVNWLVSKEPLESPSDILPWFYGPKPHYSIKKAIPLGGRGPLPGPLYCFVLENSEGEIEWTNHPEARVVLFYCFLLSYNRGKDVCLGAKIPIVGCVGGYTVMGNHVGDIETCAVVLNDEENPVRFLYGAHSFNFWNDWDNKESYCGDREEMREQGIKSCPRLQKYNSTTGKFDENGTHPVVYLAEDSHGTWISPKKHIYKKVSAIGLVLDDDTSKPGYQWETWKNIHIISKAYWSGLLDLPTPFQGIRNWFTQIQRWGDPERGCIPLVGQCRQEDGPGGFDKGAVNWWNAEDEEEPINEVNISDDAKILFR